MSKEQDKAFFRNYSIILGILAVLVVVFLGVARFVVPGDSGHDGDSSSVVENTAPVGQVRLDGEAMPEEGVMEEVSTEPETADNSVDAGKQVYSGLCFSCHGTGLPGIPQLGDKAAWVDRIAKGKDTLYNHALNGFTGSSGIQMPPKGGNTALSDDEVKAAVDYMLANAE